MITIIAVVVSLLVGFGLGRVKNAKKLATVAAYLNSVEAKASAEAKTLIADVRAKL